ncbi:MAG: hypothetical protein V1900_00245 [Candidatus Aenigmatarchaeota archaeon]
MTGFITLLVSGFLYQAKAGSLLADYSALANVLARYFVAFLFVGCAKCCMKCDKKKR